MIFQGEDWPSIGTFQYRLNGMKNPPATHYMRPFHLLHQKKFLNSKSCMHGRTTMQLNLDYAKDFMRVYNNDHDGFFGFLFLNEYSHDTHKNLPWADQEIYNFLVEFNKKAYKDNTVLIFFSDHGPRFSSIRKSIKGLLRERNPFFSIYIPKLFQERYQNEYMMFLENHNKLLTPMDVHRTLMDIIFLEKYGHVSDADDKRAKSMFQTILANRTCVDAGIDQHWCGKLINTTVKKFSNKSF